MNTTNIPNDLICNKIKIFSWCDKAFEKAKNENKPIFLSIGYS